VRVAAAPHANAASLEQNPSMTANASWAEGLADRSTEADRVDELWAEIEAQVTQPSVLTLRAAGAEITAVVGDPTGTALVYFPPGYENTATRSLHSVGDPTGAERDEWEPPLVAFRLGHHTEFPRWSVVSHDAGRQALSNFCEHPQEPPAAIAWERD
jgi:hypothetical protein